MYKRQTFKEEEKLLGRRGALYPVGRYEPSPLGLYDLVGNGFEWTNDWYAPDAYQHGPGKNPTGPSRGTEKVLRGKAVGEDFSPFPHLMRYRKNPQEYRIAASDSEAFPFNKEGIRCVVNRPDPIE